MLYCNNQVEIWKKYSVSHATYAIHETKHNPLKYSTLGLVWKHASPIFTKYGLLKNKIYVIHGKQCGLTISFPDIICQTCKNVRVNSHTYLNFFLVQICWWLDLFVVKQCLSYMSTQKIWYIVCWPQQSRQKDIKLVSSLLTDPV